MSPRVAFDITGQRFDRWTVLGRTEDQTLPSGRRLPQWLCVCDCGTVRANAGQTLRAGKTRSCGCLVRELMAAVGRSNRKTGQISYSAAHRRVRKARGSARLHPCADCGGPAREWSYDHADPKEWTEIHQRTGRPVAYSTNPDHYAPRCSACHQEFDRGRGE